MSKLGPNFWSATWAGDASRATVCPTHAIELVSLCRHCARTHRPWEKRATAIWCTALRGRLSGIPTVRRAQDPVTRVTWELIAQAQSGSPLRRAEVAAQVRSLLAEYSASEVQRQTGIADETLSRLSRGVRCRRSRI